MLYIHISITIYIYIWAKEWGNFFRADRRRRRLKMKFESSRRRHQLTSYALRSFFQNNFLVCVCWMEHIYLYTDMNYSIYMYIYIFVISCQCYFFFWQRSIRTPKNQPTKTHHPIIWWMQMPLWGQASKKAAKEKAAKDHSVTCWAMYVELLQCYLWYLAT